MPKCFQIGNYCVYFWSNETEPLHVHISKGKPTPNATKIWITSDGHCVIAHNKSRIPDHELRDYTSIIERNVDEIKEDWVERFGTMTYIR